MGIWLVTRGEGFQIKFGLCASSLMQPLYAITWTPNSRSTFYVFIGARFQAKNSRMFIIRSNKKKQIHKNTHLNHTKWRLFLIDKNTATHTLILWFGIRKLGQSIINTGFFRFCVFSSYFALCVCALIDLQLLARVTLSLVSCHVCEFISYGLIWFDLI